MKFRSGEWIVIIGTAIIMVFAVIVGTLIYLKPPPVRYVYVDSPRARAGEVVYRREGCGSCHEIFQNGASYGPSLDGTGSRRTSAWLRVYLRAPRPGVSVRPYRLRMPPYNKLAVADLSALVAYLQALKELNSQGAVRSPDAGSEMD